MSGSQPLEKNYRHSSRQPDPAYTLSEMRDVSRLQSEIDKKDAVLLDTNTAYKKMIELLNINKDMLQEQIDLMKLQRPMGKMFDMSMTLSTGTAARLVHIDFIAGNNNNMSVLPPNTNLDFPFNKLYSLTITNDGPANIVYSLNVPRGSSQATARLFPNETDELGPFSFPTFETLNVALEGGSTSAASVRIRGLA